MRTAAAARQGEGKAMLRISRCCVVALVIAACGGPETGDLHESRDAAQAPRVTQIAEIRDPTQGSRFGFGRVIALARGTLVVSEPVNYLDLGHVHVFGNPVGAWVHEALLAPPAGGSWSGWVVAAAPGWVAVGSGAYGPAAVYLYQRTGTGWVHTQTLEAPPEAIDFGTSLAMTGGELLVGGRVGLQGAVWSFEWTAGAWALRGEVPSPFAHDYDQWGAAMALDAGRAVISDPSVRWEPRFNGGVAVYDLDHAGWQLAAAIEEEDAEVGFGIRVCASGSTIAISGSTGRPAHIWNVGAAVSEEAEVDEASDDPEYGMEVAVGDNLLVVSAGASDDGETEVEGAVYVYYRTATGWSAPTMLRSPEAHATFELFGRGLAVSENLIAIGAPGAEEIGDPDDNGEVYLFEVKGTSGGGKKK
jgi:hypothetical protein